MQVPLWLINTLQRYQTRQDLEERKGGRERYFEEKFTFDDISSLSRFRAFTVQRWRNFLYRKAKNQKKADVLFRKQTNRQKIQSIHRDSKEVVTYQCGSELECLLYEYR